MQDKFSILATTQGILAQYLMHWHRLSVDASLFLGTGSVTIAGYAISRDAISVKLAITCIFVLLTLTLIGYFLRRVINRQIMMLRFLIQKIDEENGVFNSDFLSSGGALYPDSWRVKESSEWDDPIFHLTLFTIVLLPVILMALVAILAFL